MSVLDSPGVADNTYAPAVTQNPINSGTTDPSATSTGGVDPTTGLPEQPTTSYDPTQAAAGPGSVQAPAVAAPSAQQSAFGGQQPVVISQQGLAQRASQLAKMYPSMKKDPALVAALAGLPIADDDLYGAVGQTITAAQAQTQAAVLTDMTDATARWQRWQSFSKEAQAAILQTGMPAPAQPSPSHHKGFWDQLGSDLLSSGPIGTARDLVSLAENPSLHQLGQTALTASQATLGKDVIGLADQGVRNVSGALSRDVATPLGLHGLYQDTVGPITRLPGDVTNLPGHVYRFLDVGQKGGGISPSAPDLGQAQGTAKLDPSYISRAWEATAPGKPFFRQEDYERAQQAVNNDPTKLDLAVAISQSGGDITQGVQKLMGPAPVAGATPQYSDRAGQLFAMAQSDPHVIQAAKILGMAGVSPGRDGARDIGLQEGSLPYMAASGAMDAAFQWYLNPLNVVGRVNSVAKASRALSGDNLATAIDAARFPEEINGAATAGDTTGANYWRQLMRLPVGSGGTIAGMLAQRGSDVQAVADTAARQRYLVALADHVNQSNAMGWLTARPQDASAYNSFLDHVNTYLKPLNGPDYEVTPNDVLDWLDMGAGKAAIAKGQFASYLTKNDIQLPRLSKTGAAAVWAKVKATPVSALAENPKVGLDPSDVAPTQGALARIGSLLGDMPYKTHELLASGVHQGPIELVGDNAVPSFARYVRQYLLPSDRRDALVNAFADANTSQARRELVYQTTEAGMRQNGFDATEAGQQAMDRMVSGMRENYDPKGRDILDDGTHKATTLPDLEEASAMDAPTIRQLTQAARESGVLGTIRGGLTNPQFETIMHKYWTPMALLRLGFVPRIISEEFMTALMRLDPTEVAKGYAGSWAPRIARRMQAYDGLGASNPISKLGGILGARALGLIGDPELEQAGQMIQQARNLDKQSRDAYGTVTKLAKKHAKLANLLGEEHETTQQAAEREAAAREVMRETMDRAARNPVVQQAYGKIFATGGDYLHAISTTGDLESVDGKYRPIARIQMRGHYKTIQKGGIDETDPAFLTGAAEYLGKFGRSRVARAGLEAMSGYGGDARTLSGLRVAFGKDFGQERVKVRAASTLAGTPSAAERLGFVAPKAKAATKATKLVDVSDEKMLTNIRQAFADAHPDIQDGIRYYRRAVASGSVGAQVDAGSQLRDLHSAGEIGDYQLGKQEKALIDGVIGKGNYRPALKKMPDEELGNIKNKELLGRIQHYRKTRSRNVKAQLIHEIAQLDPERVARTAPESGAPLDGETIASIFSSPNSEVITSPARAATVASDAIYKYMQSPAFADYIPGSDHLQYDLAQPIPKGHTRLYYPAAPPDWQPGQLDLDAIDNEQTKADVAATVLNRRVLQTQIDQATENPTHQAIGLWAHTDPERVQRAADALAPEEGMVGYVDVPNAMRDAQRYGQASVEHLRPENPWLPEAKQAMADTKAVEKRLHASVPGLEGKLGGYRLSEEQQVRGHLIKDDHEVNDDGTWANGRSLAENMRKLANKNADALVDAFLPNGRFLHGPVHDLLRQDPDHVVFNLNHVKGIAPGDLPETVIKPIEMDISPPSLLDRATAFGFSHVIGPSLESMVRSEAFINNLAKGLRAAKVVEPHLVDQELRAYGEARAKAMGLSVADLRHYLDLDAEGGTMDPETREWMERADPAGKLADWAAMENRVDDHLNQIATERAVRDTIPYINNHHAQSNMSYYMRNVSPFLWAQESFLKRWSRALRYNPATFERLELGIHGLGSIGIIHKDQYGQDAITIPGSGALTHLLGSLHLPYQIAASVPFTMEVKSLTPGFTRPAVPAAGPAITAPLAMLMGSQPEAKALGGDLGIPPNSTSGIQGALQQLVPAGWARNLWSAYMSSPDAQQFASARLEAMQLLAASGHAPTPGADAAALQTWQSQVGNWTRNVMILRGVLGFFTPATPSFDPTTVKTLDGTVGKLHADLADDIQMFGVTEGITRFMTDHPDAGAYTVFPTSSAGGETVEATKPAEQMLSSNPAFFEAHPYAGAYFLPPAPGNFDHQAYASEIADGIRVRKGWDQIATEMVNAAASEYYYQMHDQYLQALAATAGDSTSKANVEQAWANFAQPFEAANPLFTEQLNSSTGQATRGNVIDDMRNALASGDTPNPAAAKQLSGMLQLYDYWEQAHAALSGQTTADATDQRKSIDAMFQQMATQYVAVNPLAAMFFQRTIVPQIAQSDRTLGQALEVSA